jgi:hypothetical protein
MLSAGCACATSGGTGSHACRLDRATTYLSGKSALSGDRTGRSRDRHLATRSSSACSALPLLAAKPASDTACDRCQEALRYPARRWRLPRCASHLEPARDLPLTCFRDAPSGGADPRLPRTCVSRASAAADAGGTAGGFRAGGPGHPGFLPPSAAGIARRQEQTPQTSDLDLAASVSSSLSELRRYRRSRPSANAFRRSVPFFCSGQFAGPSPLRNRAGNLGVVAGDELSRDRTQLRRLLLAEIAGDRAAWMEAAAARWIDRARRIAG